MPKSGRKLLNPYKIPAEQEKLAEQITMVGSAIILLATTAFTWWFADRSVSKALTKKLVA